MLISLLLQAASPANGFVQVLPLVGIAVVFYFFMVRPQQRRTAEQRQLRESLVKGSRVVTIGGLHATVLEVGPETVLLQAEGGQRLRFDRSAVARLAGGATESGNSSIAAG